MRKRGEERKGVKTKHGREAKNEQEAKPVNEMETTVKSGGMSDTRRRK